jgi:micrococcal nuclease
LACGLEAGPERAVAAVLDGETIKLDDGKLVRLVGALAPRASDVRAAPGLWPSEAATHAALSDLVLGRTVALAFAGRREDRFGHVLAHLFVEDADSRVWVQGRLVERGLARAAASPGNDACIAHLVERETAARAGNRGLWANSAYAVRPADRPTELTLYQGRWELVRGTVEAVSGTQSLVFVDLVSGEEPARTDTQRERPRRVRLTWRRGIERSLALAAPARALPGRDVLVRGWIAVRSGAPEIEILAAGQIDILERTETTPKKPSSSDSHEKTPGGEPAGR